MITLKANDFKIFPKGVWELTANSSQNRAGNCSPVVPAYWHHLRQRAQGAILSPSPIAQPGPGCAPAPRPARQRGSCGGVASAGKATYSCGGIPTGRRGNWHCNLAHCERRLSTLARARRRPTKQRKNSLAMRTRLAGIDAKLATLLAVVPINIAVTVGVMGGFWPRKDMTEAVNHAEGRNNATARSQSPRSALD